VFCAFVLAVVWSLGLRTSGRGGVRTILVRIGLPIAVLALVAAYVAARALAAAYVRRCS
jgi:hypothetical protein